MMKNHLLIMLAGALILGFLSCAYGGIEDVDFEVRVTGTQGLKFSGYYALSTVAGIESRKDVFGTIPQVYRLRGDFVEFTVANDAPGTIKIELIAGGKVWDDEEKTSEGYSPITVMHEF